MVRRGVRVIAVPALGLALAWSGAAVAQPAQPSQPATPAKPPVKRGAGDLKAEIDAVKKELAELRTLSVQSQTVSQSVQDLSSKVTALEQELDKLRRQQTASPEVVSGLDTIGSRLDAVERDVEALRTQVADIEQPSASATGGAVDWDGGFKWASSDGDYGLKLGGFVQPRLQIKLPEEGDTISESTFRLRRARFLASGHLSREELTWKMQAELGVDAAPALDYYLDYEFMPELAVRAGQDKVFFTRAWWASDATLDVLERPAAIDALRYDRDIGVWLHGWVADRLYYHVGVSNGAGPNKRNDNIDVAALLRVEAMVVGDKFEPMVKNLEAKPDLQLLVGAGVVHDLVRVPETIAGIEVANRDVDSNGTLDNVRVWSSSFTVAARIQGLELMTEGIWRHERWGTILDHSDNAALDEAIKPSSSGHRNYLAGFVHASYALVPKHLQAALRVGHNRVALLGVGGGGPTSVPAGDRLFELNGQLRYFLNDNLSAAISYTMTNYNATSGPDPSADVEHLFIGQGQLNF
jgi:outer membrane murein-binding lipoprotein Lpp